MKRCMPDGSTMSLSFGQFQGRELIIAAANQGDNHQSATQFVKCAKSTGIAARASGRGVAHHHEDAG